MVNERIINKLLFRISIMSLPFITIGMLGFPLVGYISAAIGAVAMLLAVTGYFVPRIACRIENITDKYAPLIEDILLLPYVFALIGTIVHTHGIQGRSAYILSLCFLMFDIARFIVKNLKK